VGCGGSLVAIGDAGCDTGSRLEAAGASLSARGNIGGDTAGGLDARGGWIPACEIAIPSTLALTATPGGVSCSKVSMFAGGLDSNGAEVSTVSLSIWPDGAWIGAMSGSICGAKPRDRSIRPER